ncbi:hypothetical protein FB451DRAFT_1444806 [Mycena latifolia]|nr:hypothetical protein FB451DRAFT_1444806 [Mycena latifolia]
MPLLPFLPLGLSPSSSLGFGWPSLALLLPLFALFALVGYVYLPPAALRSRPATLPFPARLFPALPFPFRAFPCLPSLRPCSHPNPTAPIPSPRR